VELGHVGIWSISFRGKGASAIAEAAAYLEDLGFRAVWIPGARGGDIFGDVGAALGATTDLVVATGIVNIWMHDAAEVAAAHRSLTESSGHRFLLGLGVSHARTIESLTDRRYERPLELMGGYLDQLDSVPRTERVLAALGPRMLELARDRTAGAHPYLTAPEHTAFARGVLGPGPLLAPDLKVILSTDPGVARARARATFEGYLRLSNYVNNLLRMGFTEADLADGGSDRLIDRVIAWGDEAAIAARIREHLDAGADHVCVQILSEERNAFPWEEWRTIAGVAEEIG
jgi:probable F420-dependent oxidoreductase